ncbi:galactose-1-epimerase [Agarivorans sp. MS3-6]|uniref:galactose-1-epimerase n=1 Tax=Agarivorans sp. TSD2052 TaxID=2937286 RepID=UPI00200C8E99|nr:galactose-1-epimerase [Agarivorans sp. TSD2052]UPW18988.1 galactose-1-epimerase [Agarivorans sp. TSD2052]
MPTIQQDLTGQTFTLKNNQGSEAVVLAWGATLASLKIKLNSGELRQVVLGCDSFDDYFKQNAYLGATVGRYANRINQAKIGFQGEEFILTANQDMHQLHGANDLSHRDWQGELLADNKVRFTIQSPDGEMGFPGNLQAQLDYTLDDDNQLVMDYSATVDQTCPVNLTDHSYFNLNAASSTILQHQLFIAADQYLPVASDGIPLDGLHTVADTSFDFRQSKTIAEDLLKDEHQALVGGYDHSYLLQADVVEKGKAVARIVADDQSLAMEVYTDKPAIQLYTGNFLKGNPGHNGEIYQAHSGVALETQFLPDSPNRPDWPHKSCWLAPGETYRYQTRYRLYQPS